jgi:hypothetical protein
MENRAGRSRGSADAKMEHARGLGVRFSCSHSQVVLGQTCLYKGDCCLRAKFGRCEPPKEPAGLRWNPPEEGEKDIKEPISQWTS